MRFNDWVASGDSFIIGPVMRRVYAETTFGAGVFVAAALLEPKLAPIVLRLGGALVLITHVRRKYERTRLTVDNGRLKVETASWAGAGRWVHQGDWPPGSIAEVGYYCSVRTTKVAVARADGSGDVVVSSSVSRSDTKRLAEALAAKLDCTAVTWRWTQLVKTLLRPKAGERYRRPDAEP